jgi:hypothetical protein
MDGKNVEAGDLVLHMDENGVTQELRLKTDHI